MPSILVAFSDTGGGHRAAATALTDALRLIEPDVQVRLVDPFAESKRWPFDRLSAAYPRVVNNASWLWRSGFHLTDSPRVTEALQALAWPALRRGFDGIDDGTLPDLVVSTHPLLTAPLHRVLPRTPLAVVVTDLASGHTSWYDRRAALVTVPTEQARVRAIAGGVAFSRVEVHGVPVSPQFAACEGERAALQARLGWSQDRPTAVLIGGGDGVGPIERLAVELDQAGLGCDLAIVAGRNSALAERLRARAWRGTVHVYGFVQGLGEMFRAASIIISKAGPGTISEACAARCPLVLYGAIPGQETGNVEHVVKNGAGVWAPEVPLVVQSVRAWSGDARAETARAEAADAARVIAKPHAARDIARRLLALAARHRLDPPRSVHHSGKSDRPAGRSASPRPILNPCTVRFANAVLPLP